MPGNVLSIDEYRDKVRGCWLGKSIGGTLGAPLEGKKGLFSLEFYDPLPTAPIPNDDLDIQLVWVHALKQCGIHLTSADLAREWLEHIVYHWDEYGCHTHNLRKGLLPPVSGWYNNWHIDSEGSPIRSEIWAVIAPGCPDIAAEYARQDAMLDHAGGEGVYGEVFLSALQSAAFLESDPRKLIEIGLSMIPEECRTARAVRDVVKWYDAGIGWEECRELLLEKHGRSNPQDSPQNQGIVVLGWLYGNNDFGDSILKAVNCGEDTDCTGATLGAILGIILGGSQIPRKWLEPVSDAVVSGWGIVGLDHPRTVDELTEDCLNLAKKVLEANRVDLIADDRGSEAVSYAGRRLASTALAHASGSVGSAAEPHSEGRVTAVEYNLGPVSIHIDYLGYPTISYDSVKRIAVRVRNTCSVPLSGTISVRAPEGWSIFPEATQSLRLVGGLSCEEETVGSGQWGKASDCECACVLDLEEAASDDRCAELSYAFLVEDSDSRRVRIGVTNPLQLQVEIAGMSPVSVDFALLGERPWLIAGSGGCAQATMCSAHLSQFVPFGDSPISASVQGLVRDFGFSLYYFPEDQFDLSPCFDGRQSGGSLYMLHYVFSNHQKDIIVGLDSNHEYEAWLNGCKLAAKSGSSVFRPKRRYGTSLVAGWNALLIEITKCSDDPVLFHRSLMDTKRHGLTDVIDTYLPTSISRKSERK